MAGFFLLKVVQLAPVRYGLFKGNEGHATDTSDGQFFFTLTYTTLKKHSLPIPKKPAYFLAADMSSLSHEGGEEAGSDISNVDKGICKEVRLEDKEVASLALSEQQVLKAQLEQYLARKECSVRALIEWLRARKLPSTWQNELHKYAIKSGFLSEERYFRYALDKAKMVGKSKLLLQKELHRDKINLEKPFITNELEAYEDEVVAKNLLENRIVKRKLKLALLSAKELDKLVQYAVRRGFSYALIIGLIDKIKRQQNNDEA